MFDQEVARKALYSMIILHEYPLSIVGHHDFCKFVSALQPLFKMATRNSETLYDICPFGEEAAGTYVTEAHELLTDMMKHYNVNQDFVAISSGGVPSSIVNAIVVLFIFKTLAANKKTTSLVRSKNELDRYLEEETLPHDDSHYFDILG